MFTNLVCLLLFGANIAQATEADLFGDPSANKTSVAKLNENTSLMLSGSFDFRAVHTGSDGNWKNGGPGISSYGSLLGSPNSSDTSFKIPRIAMVADMVGDKNLSAHLQLNYDDLPDPRQNSTNLGLTEAFVQYLGGECFKIRAGVLIPPVSMEHSSRSWSTRYSVTPSAINTWIGEEIRVNAVESDFSLFHSGESELHLLIAPFSNNDPAGSILAWRGWALHDYQHRIGSRLRFQSDVPTSLSSSGWDTPYKEIDGRMGVYEKLGWKLNDQWLFDVFNYDNMGSSSNQDPNSFGGDFAWATRFTEFGIEWNRDGPLTLVTQYLFGGSKAQNATTTVTNITYDAFYILASYRMAAKHRVTLRFDNFHVVDQDFFADNNSQTGTAQLIAYLYSVTDNQTLTTEYLHPETHRPGNTGSNSDPSDDIFQVNYRLLF